jgi:hypothetical protein
MPVIAGAAVRTAGMVVVGCLALLAAAPTASAGLLGATVTYEFLDPTTSNVADSMGPTTLTSSTSFDDTHSFADIDTTFSDNQIIITNLCNCNFVPETFEGPSYIFSGVTLANATIDPASASDFLGVLSFTADNIMINFGNLGASDFIPPGNQLIIDVTTAPEPSSVALLGAAVLCVLGVTRGRRLWTR